MTLNQSTHGKFALRFAEFLAKEDFESAYTLLSSDETSVLEDDYSEMISYGDGPVTDVEVITEMEYWPAKKENDIGWVYVAMSGPGYSEAITVIVSETGEGIKITSIEWGRP